MRKIHNTSIISDKAIIGENVEIGPYCIIGDKVDIGEGTILKSHIIIEGDTKIGKNNIIFPFASIGVDPQDLKFSGEQSKTIIGDNNKIREHVTIHKGTKDGAMVTKIGSNCLFMVGVHIAHDCIIGNNVIMANNATLAGHVEVGDGAVIGGLSAAHQFVRIGKGAMIGGMSGIENDVIPYGLVAGERAYLAGLNLVGLKRKKVAHDEIHELRAFYKEIFNEDGKSFLERVNDSYKYKNNSLINDLHEFLNQESSRSFCQPKKK